MRRATLVTTSRENAMPRTMARVMVVAGALLLATAGASALLGCAGATGDPAPPASEAGADALPACTDGGTK